MVPHAPRDASHALLAVSPKTSANRNRCKTPALLRALIFGSNGCAMSPIHARRRRGQLVPKPQVRCAAQCRRRVSWRPLRKSGGRTEWQG
jgi:hypothetical protein